MRRLEAILALIPETARRVADVGYDHGYLIRDLVARRPRVRVIGIDRQVDAAARFERNVASHRPGHRDRITLRRGDGLTALVPGEVDVAVFAGLAERKTWQLLEDGAEVVRELPRLVFAPVTNFAYLKPRLRDAGWRTVDERLVYEGGRYYLAFAVERGEEIAIDPVTWHFGSLLFERGEPLLPGYLGDIRHRYRKAFAHAAHQTEDMQEMIRHWAEAMRRCEAFES